jgi:hypothetical protein
LLCDFVSSLAAGSNRDLLAVHTHRHGRTLAISRPCAITRKF